MVMEKYNKNKKFLKSLRLPTFVLKNGIYFSKLFRHKEGLKPFIWPPNLRSKHSISEERLKLRGQRSAGHTALALEPTRTTWTAALSGQACGPAACSAFRRDAPLGGSLSMTHLQHQAQRGREGTLSAPCSPCPPSESASSQNAQCAIVGSVCHNYFPRVSHFSFTGMTFVLFLGKKKMFAPRLGWWMVGGKVAAWRVGGKFWNSRWHCSQFFLWPSEN